MSAPLLQGRKFAVLLGGTAAEREISLESGGNVAAALEAADAQVVRVDPAVDGWPERLQGVEIVFNLLHGPGGEDGTLQGLFELMKLPYSGSGVLGSALTMDKVRTKQLWLGCGLPTPEFTVLDADTDWSAFMSALEPCLLNPPWRGRQSV